MAAVQIAPVAQRACIAAGTVYRYFPGKTDLVAALIAEIAEREIAVLRRATTAAPGPLSALAAAIMTFAARAMRHRRLAFAVIAEPIAPDLDAARLSFRQAVAGEFVSLISAAIADKHLPEQDAALSAAVSPLEVSAMYVVAASNRVSFVSAPTRIRAQLAAGQVQLLWSGGLLQSADVVSGPYNDVQGATAPYR